MFSNANVKALFSSITKKETIDDKVASAMAALAEEVLEDVVVLASKLAKHRQAGRVEQIDVKFAFERRTKLKVPYRLDGQKDSVMQFLPQIVVKSGAYRKNLELVKKEIEKAAH